MTEEWIVEMAREMLDELHSGCLEVVLIPAPDSRHLGHMIRAKQCQNADWYREYAKTRSRPAPIKSRPRVKRERTISALERIIEGRTKGTAEEDRLLEFMKQRKEKLDKQKEFVPPPDDDPYWTIPF